MIEFDHGSFKDPVGRVFYHEGSVFRTLTATGKENFEAAKRSALLDTLEKDELIIPAILVRAVDVGVNPSVVGQHILKQHRVHLVSYSYEWSFEMLRDAALTTLRVQACALAAGFTLKDGTSFNILFDGLHPRFVDLPSIEPYRAGQVWSGYAQFCRSFLFPLLIASYRGIDFRPLLRGVLGELPSQDATRFFSMRDIVRPGIFKDVLAQARLDRTFAGAQLQIRGAATSLQYPKTALVKAIERLIRVIGDLPNGSADSAWLNYESKNSYSEIDRRTKAVFVQQALQDWRAETVIDLGCNTGEYSRMALDHVSHVVALDMDPSCIDRLYRVSDARQTLHLAVADLLNPSPAMGWALRERRGLYERLKADGVLALGLVHHLRITGGVPLNEIVSTVFSIAPNAVVEWIDKRDPMVAQMLSLRTDAYDDYEWPAFEQLLAQHGRVTTIASTHDGCRRLCHVRAVAA